MHVKKELSDKINLLFGLNSGEFNPRVHLPLAEFIVNKIGVDRFPILRAAELISFDMVDFGVKTDLPLDRTGLYNVRHIGKLAGCYYLGYYPKLKITPWMSESFSMSGDSIELLEISYNGKQVKGLMRAKETFSSLVMGRLSLSLSRINRIWTYKL